MPGENGEYTGDDLAAAVQISDQLNDLGRNDLTEISKDDFVKILMFRMGFKHEAGVNDKYANPGMKAAAEIIYDAMDERMRTNAIASNIDLRPYLDVLNGKTLLVRREYVGPDDTDEEIKYETVTTSDFTSYLQTELEKTITSQFDGTDLSDADRQRIVNEIQQYDPAKVGIEISQEDLAYAAGQGPAESELTFTSTSAQVNGGRMVLDQIEQAFRSDFLTLDQLVSMEADNAGALPEGFIPVGVEATGRPRSMRPTSYDPSMKTLSVAQTVAFLYEKTPEEVTALQAKLAAAGYFDRVGAVTYGKGDQTDEATNEAWKLLVTDAIKRGQSIPALLGTGARDYREKVRTERMGALSKLDPSYSQVLADDWAQSVIGRRLSPSEQNQLTVQLQSLIRNRAGFVAGAGDNTATEGLQGETGVTNTDITIALEDKYSLEQRRTGWSEAVLSQLGG